MKNILIILISITLFLISCQTNAENIEIKSEKIQQELSAQPIETPKIPMPKPNQNDMNLKLGLVSNNGKKQIVCLRINNADLAEKTPVKIVDPYGQPQTIVSAEVKKKLEENCTSTKSNIGVENPENTFYYSLNLLEGEREQSIVGIGIGIINPSNSATIDEGLVSIDINNDGKSEYFRHCAGIDGTLLTVWTGKPLEGKRMWVSFYYLDYDTETDCTEKESEVSDN